MGFFRSQEEKVKRRGPYGDWMEDRFGPSEKKPDPPPKKNPVDRNQYMGLAYENLTPTEKARYHMSKHNTENSPYHRETEESFLRRTGENRRKEAERKAALESSDPYKYKIESTMKPAKPKDTGMNYGSWFRERFGGKSSDDEQT